MSRNLCVVQDFLTEAHKARIREAAERTGFTPHFFTTAELDAAKACLQSCEVIYAQRKDLAEAAPATLGWYAASSAGVDAYCEPGLFKNPDCLLTAANVYGVTIAEHVIMVTLMLLRRMPYYETDIRERRWSVPVDILSIRGGAFTILGTGNIGTNVAERLRGMGAAKITGVSRSGRPSAAFDEVYPIAQLDEVLARAEFVIMALPGTAETVGIMSRARLALLPKGAYLVNVGRGAALDQAALRDALEAGALAGAALDVMTPEPLPADDPLWGTRNLLLTPHVSGNMTLGYTGDANVDLFCENLTRYVEGKPLRGQVDRKRGY